jgi:hypothetical protein
VICHDKEATIIEVKRRAREMGAVAVMSISEAWMSRVVAPTPWHLNRRLPTMPPPSEDPQRREIVVIAATDGERSVAKLLQIVRDKPGGRIMSLVLDEPPDDGGGVKIGGQMIGGIIPRRS